MIIGCGVMRNYIGELRTRGITLKTIAKGAHISPKKVSDFYHGKLALKSGTKEYEKIRNLSRRTAYGEMRKIGITSAEARQTRRVAYSPEWQPKEKRVIREVKFRQDTTRYQLYVVAEFKHSRTHEVRILKGTSYAHLDYDYDRDLKEAIGNIRGQLNDSHWQLQRVIEYHIIEYKLKP